MFGYWLAGQKMFGHVLFRHVLSFNIHVLSPILTYANLNPLNIMVSVTPGWKTLTSDFLGVGGPGSTIGMSIADML